MLGRAVAVGKALGRVEAVGKAEAVGKEDGKADVDGSAEALGKEVGTKHSKQDRLQYSSMKV